MQHSVYYDVANSLASSLKIYLVWLYHIHFNSSGNQTMYYDWMFVTPIRHHVDRKHLTHMGMGESDGPYKYTVS